MKTITLSKTLPEEFLANSALIIVNEGFTRQENETDDAFVARYFADLFTVRMNYIKDKYKKIALAPYEAQFDAETAPLMSAPEITIE